MRSCARRGVAIDLVLDRAKENRSQFMFTRLAGGREGIFWQSARTTRKARPTYRIRFPIDCALLRGLKYPRRMHRR